MAKVDGNKILYHYLQKDLRESDFPLYLQMVMKLVTDLGVWIHPDDYKKLPIVMPYVVRDPTLTTKVRTPWGNPQPHTGLMKDDNSMVKAIAKGKKKKIESAVVSKYDGGILGKNFVASHVWREIKTDADLTNRDHRLFTFIPNLVWLPKEISKFTDREGSIIQSLIQQISMKIYRNLELSEPVEVFTEEAWKVIETCEVKFPLPDEAIPDVSQLTFIRISDSYIRSRTRKIGRLAQALTFYSQDLEYTSPSISSKYDPLINTIDKGAAAKLGAYLTRYYNAVKNPTTSE